MEDMENCHAWISLDCKSFCPWSWVWECRRTNDAHLGQQLPFLKFPEKAVEVRKEVVVGVLLTLGSVGGADTFTSNLRPSL